MESTLWTKTVCSVEVREGARRVHPSRERIMAIKTKLSIRDRWGSEIVCSLKIRSNYFKGEGDLALRTSGGLLGRLSGLLTKKFFTKNILLRTSEATSKATFKMTPKTTSRKVQKAPRTQVQSWRAFLELMWLCSSRPEPSPLPSHHCSLC